jgi:hypothetical protein
MSLVFANIIFGNFKLVTNDMFKASADGGLNMRPSKKKPCYKILNLTEQN